MKYLTVNFVDGKTADKIQFDVLPGTAAAVK